jgi:class 3 adenylate cyclase
MDRQLHQALTNNTWGDGLYCTFKTVAHANDFALDLSEFVNETKWQDFGLPAELNLRIALHAGPVFEILDPVTRQQVFIGTHVSRAARIEPITPPGNVYCSEAHAALVALEKSDLYHCEFVGNTPYAKDFGTFPTYSLMRRQQATAGR